MVEIVPLGRRESAGPTKWFTLRASRRGHARGETTLIFFGVFRYCVFVYDYICLYAFNVFFLPWRGRRRKRRLLRPRRDARSVNNARGLLQEFLSVVKAKSQNGPQTGNSLKGAGFAPSVEAEVLTDSYGFLRIFFCRFSSFSVFFRFFFRFFSG